MCPYTVLILCIDFLIPGEFAGAISASGVASGGLVFRMRIFKFLVSIISSLNPEKYHIDYTGHIFVFSPFLTPVQFEVTSNNSKGISLVDIVLALFRNFFAL